MAKWHEGLPYGDTCHGLFVRIVDLRLRWWIVGETAVIAAMQWCARDAVAWLRFHARRLLLMKAKFIKHSKLATTLTDALSARTHLFAEIRGGRQWFAILRQRRSTIRRETMRLCQMTLRIWRRHNWWWHRCGQCGRWTWFGRHHTISAAINHATHLLRLTVHDGVAEHACRRMLFGICVQLGRYRRRRWFIFFDQCVGVEGRRFRCAVALLWHLQLLLLLLLMSILAVRSCLYHWPIRLDVVILEFGVGNREPTEQLRAQIFTELPALGTVAHQCNTIVFMEC